MLLLVSAICDFDPYSFKFQLTSYNSSPDSFPIRYIWSQCLLCSTVNKTCWLGPWFLMWRQYQWYVSWFFIKITITSTIYWKTPLKFHQIEKQNYCKHGAIVIFLFTDCLYHPLLLLSHQKYDTSQYILLVVDWNIKSWDQICFIEI